MAMGNFEMWWTSLVDMWICWMCDLDYVLVGLLVHVGLCHRTSGKYLCRWVGFVFGKCMGSFVCL